MQWALFDRRHGGDLEDDDVEGFAAGERRRRFLVRASAIGGALVLVVLALVALLRAPHGLLADVFPQRRGPAVERPADPAASGPDATFHAVLADTSEVWGRLLGSYEPPRLAVLEPSADRNALTSGCEFATSAVGPFYCPADRKVFLDREFLRDLEQRYGTAASFAPAYVVAHAVGHHVQLSTGLLPRIEAQMASADDLAQGQLSLRQELQADCYAGVFTHHSPRMSAVFTPADFEAGLAAAAAIGGDTLANSEDGTVRESFTHATAAQRSEWFRRGLARGDMQDCNAFEVVRL